MKKILFLLFVVSSLALSQSSTRTTSFRLPQWGTGDTLKAGAKNDSSQSNYSLNNAFYRLETILGRGHDSIGFHKNIATRANTDMTIDPGAGTVNLLWLGDALGDSVAALGNMWIYGSLGVTGTAQIVGALTADTIVVTKGLYTTGSAHFPIITGNVNLQGILTMGTNQASAGRIRFWDGANNYYSEITANNINITANRQLSLPNLTGTLVTTDGNQNLTNVGGIAADSVQSPTVTSYIYNDSPVALPDLSDSSQNYASWKAYGVTNFVKVRSSYLHKSGVTRVKAYYQGRAGNGSSGAGYTRLAVGSLGASFADVTDETFSWGSNSVDVNTLTSGTVYPVTFAIRAHDTMDSCFVKQLTIVAESQ